MRGVVHICTVTHIRLYGCALAVLVEVGLGVIWHSLRLHMHWINVFLHVHLFFGWAELGVGMCWLSLNLRAHVHTTIIGMYTYTCRVDVLATSNLYFNLWLCHIFRTYTFPGESYGPQASPVLDLVNPLLRGGKWINAIVFFFCLHVIHVLLRVAQVSEMKQKPMGEDFWPFRPAPSIGPPAQQDSSPPARPVLTMDPSFGRDRNWSPKGSPPRVPTTSWRPWEPPLPETWGCPRGPFAEQLWKLGLRPDGPNLPGVENDVSETALRAASKLSDTEFQLRSLAGNEEEQLQQLRARHQQNLESLGMLQKSMLLPTATVTPSDMSMPPMPPMPPVPPVPPVALRARDADLSPSMRWDGAPLQDLVAASVADGLGLTGIASLSAGPLPRCAEWLSRGPAMVATAIPQAGTAPDLFETAGPLPPPALSDTGEDAFQTQGLEGRL